MTAPTQFRATKLYDVLAAAPMILLYGLGISYKLVPDILASIGKLPSTGALLDIARDASSIVYFGLIIALVLFRRVPLARSTGILPRAVALVSVTMAVARPKLLEFAVLPLWLETATIVLTVLGTVASVAVLIRLGRSFSLLPEARALVTDGPYRLIRHPLYAAEELGNIGIMLQYVQPWSLLIEIVSIATQLWRISFEERVLAQAFPEYADYARRTRRLIPGIY